MTDDTPMKLVIDLTEAEPDPNLQTLVDAVDVAIKSGDPQIASTAAEKLGAAITASLAAQTPTMQYLPLSDEDLAQQALDLEAALEQARTAKTAQVQAALDTTNNWVIEAFESGGQLSKSQAAYRASLRALFPEVTAAADLAAVDAIEIPDPPTG